MALKAYPGKKTYKQKLLLKGLPEEQAEARLKLRLAPLKERIGTSELAKRRAFLALLRKNTRELLKQIRIARVPLPPVKQVFRKSQNKKKPLTVQEKVIQDAARSKTVDLLKNLRTTNNLKTSLDVLRALELEKRKRAKQLEEQLRALKNQVSVRQPDFSTIVTVALEFNRLSRETHEALAKLAKAKPNEFNSLADEYARLQKEALAIGKAKMLHDVEKAIRGAEERELSRELELTESRLGLLNARHKTGRFQDQNERVEQVLLVKKRQMLKAKLAQEGINTWADILSGVKGAFNKKQA